MAGGAVTALKGIMPHRLNQRSISRRMGIVALPAIDLIPAQTQVLLRERCLNTVVTVEADTGDIFYEQSGKRRIVRRVAAQAFAFPGRVVNHAVGHPLLQIGVARQTEPVRSVQKQ